MVLEAPEKSVCVCVCALTQQSLKIRSSRLNLIICLISFCSTLSIVSVGLTLRIC